MSTINSLKRQPYGRPRPAVSLFNKLHSSLNLYRAAKSVHVARLSPSPRGNTKQGFLSFVQLLEQYFLHLHVSLILSRTYQIEPSLQLVGQQGSKHSMKYLLIVYQYSHRSQELQSTRQSNSLILMAYIYSGSLQFSDVIGGVHIMHVFMMDLAKVFSDKDKFEQAKCAYITARKELFDL